MVTINVGCPPEREIAAFVDGVLPPDERAAVQRHVDTCASCFDLIATLSRLDEQELPNVEPDLQRAVLHRPVQRPSLFRQLPALGAAAAVLLAVAWWKLPERPHMPTAAPAVVAPAAPQSAEATRSMPSTIIAVEQPRDGETINGQPEVRWTAPAEAVTFEVVVTSAAGDTMWQQRLAGTVRSTRVEGKLPPGQAYYLWVAAYLPEGRRLISNVVRVHTAEP
jgi:anti-sigma factor RsiW